MDFTITIPILIAITLGVTEVVKRVKMPTRFLPLVALVIGIALAFIAQIGTIGINVLAGLTIGLTASGLFSGVKATIEKTEVVEGKKK